MYVYIGVMFGMFYDYARLGGGLWHIFKSKCAHMSNEMELNELVCLIRVLSLWCSV